MFRSPRFWFVVKTLLAVAILWFLFQRISWPEIVAAIGHANPWIAGAALALLPLNIGLEAYRWWRLVRRVNPVVRFRDALRAVVGSYPLGLLTPVRVGDYVGRAMLLRSIRPGQSAALTFAERMATLAWCLIAGLLATAPFLSRFEAESPLWTTLIGASLVGVVLLVAGILFPGEARRIIAAVLPFRPVRKAFSAFGKIPAGESVLLLFLSGIRYAVFSFQFVLLIQALAPGVTWSEAWIGVALVYFAKSVIPQVTLGDLGIREGASVFFLGAYGVAEAAALEASLGVFVINLLLPAFIGIPLLLRWRFGALPTLATASNGTREAAV